MSTGDVIWQNGDARLEVIRSRETGKPWIAAYRGTRLQLVGWGLRAWIAGDALTFAGAVRKAKRLVCEAPDRRQRLAKQGRRVAGE